MEKSGKTTYRVTTIVELKRAVTRPKAPRLILPKTPHAVIEDESLKMEKPVTETSEYASCTPEEIIVEVDPKDVYCAD